MPSALSNLDLPFSESQPVCELCRSNPASFRYEVFSAEGLVTGDCCLRCFPDLLRATPCGLSVETREP
jgi:hypothetical protein